MNNKLIEAGFKKKFNTIKLKDIDKVKNLLRSLHFEEKEIKKYFLLISVKRFIYFIFITIAHLALILFLISVLADGLLDYKLAFWISTPFIFYFLYYFIPIVITSFKYMDDLNIFDLIRFVLAMLNVILFCLTLMLWLDLFDGTTEVLFP